MPRQPPPTEHRRTISTPNPDDEAYDGQPGARPYRPTASAYAGCVGELTSVIDGETVLGSRAHDDAGALLSSSLPLPSGEIVTKTYTLDDHHEVIGIETSDGLTIDHQRNERGGIVRSTRSVADGPPQVEVLTWYADVCVPERWTRTVDGAPAFTQTNILADGLWVTSRREQGDEVVEVERLYDARGHLSGTETSQDGELVERTEEVRGEDGALLERDRYLRNPSGELETNTSEVWTYDALGQPLTHRSYRSDARQDLVFEAVYTYDTAGRLVLTRWDLQDYVREDTWTWTCD